MTDLVIGMDVGSTTVKAAVVRPEDRQILWSDYRRHETRQPETVLAFLERILAEFPAQPENAWLLYNIWEVRHDTAERSGLRGVDGGRNGLAQWGEYGVLRRGPSLWAAEKALRGGFRLFAALAGLRGYHLPDMDEVAAVASPYYNNALRGGDGHMEIGKVILNVVRNKANMTVSVKPFGCMPSSGVSDGVQSLVQERHPRTIFCAVETTGDGAVNFQSRIQLSLFKDKEAAAREYQKALAETGLSPGAVRAYLLSFPGRAASLRQPPHRASTTAADVVYDVGAALRRLPAAKG